MAVIASREVIPRTFSHKFGESPTAERKFVVTVDAPTPTQDVIGAVGIIHGTSHPEFGFLSMAEASVTETDRHHVEITYRYEVAPETEQNPLLRPDVWSFSTGGASVPALTYLDEADALRPLVNAAGDFIEGLQTEEAEVRATISGNRLTFPLAIAASVTNSLNDAPYLGGSRYTWKCAGIGGQQETEVVNGEELRYYKITVELVYRASGWPLVLPDVGWDYLEGGEKKRAWVWFDPGNGEPKTQVPSGSPRPLDGNGGLLPDGEPPRLIVRRVNRAVDFAAYFGTPSF